MIKNKSILIAFSTVLLATQACSSILLQAEPTSPAVSTLELPQSQGNIPQTEAGVPRVTVDDAKAALDSGKAIIVDVRSQDAFARDHIAGAILIPLALIESDSSGLDLDKGQWIITYCT